MTIKGFDAVIFDMDGVVTDTASLHGQAWKETFDALLKLHKNNTEVDTKEFNLSSDYLKYVDGKTRYEGVISFLKSRNLSLPMGNADDVPSFDTYCAVGNEKNKRFNELLAKNGPQLFDSTIELIKSLLENDIKIGLASSSKNCKPIIKAASVEHYFQAIVDGVYSAEHNLKSKPNPDIFIEAAELLNVDNTRCIVIEDAESGVKAGKDGGFGLVVGIARQLNNNKLKSAGADLVVNDADELNLEILESWFETGIYEDSWSLRYTDFIGEKQKHRETLLSIGNGYFVSRGAICEAKADDFNYPGTYMSGVYNSLESAVAGKMIWNEDLVNCPNWLYTSFRINKEEIFELKDLKILDIERRLDFRTGFLSAWMLVEDAKGRITMLETLRFASMDNKHFAALEHSVTPINYSGEISIISYLSANHMNDGVERYRQLNQYHLKNIETGFRGNQHWLTCKTKTSEIEIALAAYTSVNINDSKQRYEEYEGGIRVTYTAEVSENQEFVLQKSIAISNNLDQNDTLDAVKRMNMDENDFDILAAQSRRAWQKIWDKIDIKISGDRQAQKLLRLNLYHLIITSSPHSAELDTGIPARGWHGEAYRGHIFWDELFILPLYNIHYPEVSKASLMYRYRRLDAAKKYAADNGYKGAMFPWQSGINGSEQTQIIHLNPISKRWDADHSSLQRHISLAIALNIVRYYEHTGDKVFMNNFGMEMLYEISRFWASIAYLGKDKKYHIDKVMGPDEFHEKKKDSVHGGFNDNAYTNIMCIWLWNKTLKLTSALGENLGPIFEKININFSEFDNWQQIAAKLNIEISNEGIIEQFEGFNNLEELDWDAYKNKYGDIARLDRILKAEGLSPDNYKVLKQADTLMVFFNLNKDEIAEIFEDRYEGEISDLLKINFDYYYKRTSHGSSLSSLVHSKLARDLGYEKEACELFKDVLKSDYIDIQGSTTAEGIHTGAMAGSILLILTAFAGINLKSNTLNINPKLPENWNNIHVKFQFRETKLELIIYKDSINIKADKDIGIRIQGTPLVIEKDDWWNIEF